MDKCYPINLILEGQDCLVVGGGQTAERKVKALKEAGGEVRVVTLAATDGLQLMAQDGRIRLELRAVSEADLQGAFVVIVATNDEELNRSLAAAAHANRQLVNVVDVPALCNFYVPASVRRGPLLFTVGSDGEAPALTKHLRRRLEEEFGPEYGEFAEMLGAVRDQVKSSFATQAERAALWERIVGSRVLQLLREDRREEAIRLIEAFVTER